MIREHEQAFYSALCGIALLVGAAHAAHAAIAYVSGTGTATTVCAVSNPCRQISNGVTAAGAGGTVIIMDDGDFNCGFTISSSVTIRGNDYRGDLMQCTGGTAITVSAGSSDTVHLENLSLNGTGSASYGIYFTSGALLDIDSFNIEGFTAEAVYDSSTGRLEMRHSRISGTNTLGAAYFNTFGQEAHLHDITFDTGTSGTFVRAVGGANVTITDSRFEGSTTYTSSYGVSVVDSSYGTTVDVRNCHIKGLAYGIFSQGSKAQVRIEYDTITRNTTALFGSGLICSFGHNDIMDNGTDGTPSTCSGISEI